MQCQTCAADITDDSRYCSRCGTVLGTDAGPAHAGGKSTAAGASASIVSASARPDRLSGRALTGLVAEDANPDANTYGAVATIGGMKRLNGHSVHSLLTQANLHRMRGQFTEAVDCCVAVLRTQASNVTAHSLLGDVYRDQGKLDDAIQWYRMAVELRPNPADQAKLTDMERQRRQTEKAGDSRRRAGRGTASGADPLASATGLNTGTSNLMGLSPRRWLRGIWIVSLAFLAIVLAALIATQSQRPNRLAKSKAGSGSGTGFGGGISPSALPPLDVRHRAAVSSLQPAGAAQTTGAGLPQDQSGAGGQIRRAPERPAQQTAVPAAQPMPPAPVLSVRPMETASSAIGRAPRDGSVGVPQDTLQPMSLTGGLRLEEVRYIGNNTAAVFVTAPQELVADANDNVRELLIRNVYRAAHTAFAQNSAYTHVTVFVQAPVPAAGGDAVLLEAGMDRQTAIAATPDTDTLSSLTARLQSVKWSAPMVAGSTSTTDASGSDNVSPPH